MNEKRYFRTLFCTAALATGLLAAGCADDTLTIGGDDADKYQYVEQTYCSLRNTETLRMQSSVGIYEGRAASFELSVNLSRTMRQAADFRIAVDAGYLEEYNRLHGTEYELWPSLSGVELEEEGLTVVAPGYKVSEGVTVTLAEAAPAAEGKVYAIPFTVTPGTEGVETTGEGAHHLLFVENRGTVPDAGKGDVKVVMVLEVNDTNPLNVLEWTMAESGKPLCDYMVIFAANINYDEASGRPYIFNNPNVQYLLDHRAEFIRPLQDRGIKVLVGILNNHDRAGVAQLADPTAHDFARELKNYCEAFELDGVMFDDEYAATGDGPAFVAKNSRAGAYLCYATKRAMPHKTVSVYAYLTLKSFLPSYVFNGMMPGDYVDFAVADYRESISVMNFPGSTQSQIGGKSLQLRQHESISTVGARSIRDAGYGYVMTFGMDPKVYSTMLQTEVHSNLGKGLYDEDVVFSGYYYEKNSTERKRFAEYN